VIPSRRHSGDRNLRESDWSMTPEKSMNHQHCVWVKKVKSLGSMSLFFFA
jgi:hypothetical protein